MNVFMKLFSGARDLEVLSSLKVHEFRYIGAVLCESQLIPCQNVDSCLVLSFCFLYSGCYDVATPFLSVEEILRASCKSVKHVVDMIIPLEIYPQ